MSKIEFLGEDCRHLYSDITTLNIYKIHLGVYSKTAIEAIDHLLSEMECTGGYWLTFLPSQVLEENQIKGMKLDWVWLSPEGEACLFYSSINRVSFAEDIHYLIKDAIKFIDEVNSKKYDEQLAIAKTILKEFWYDQDKKMHTKKYRELIGTPFNPISSAALDILFNEYEDRLIAEEKANRERRLYSGIEFDDLDEQIRSILDAEWNNIKEK